MSKIEMDTSSLSTAAIELKTAVDDFDPQYKEFVGSIMDCLESCSSDYLIEFKKLLRIFKDERTKKTWDAVSIYCDDLNDIFHIWDETEEIIVQKIREGGNKKC